MSKKKEQQPKKPEIDRSLVDAVVTWLRGSKKEWDKTEWEDGTKKENDANKHEKTRS